MRLGGQILRRLFREGTWICKAGGIPQSLEEMHIGPNSVDVHLGDVFQSYSADTVIDPRNPETLHMARWTASMLIVEEKDFFLGHTIEAVDCTAPVRIDGKDRYFAMMYDGRSTLGRLGIGSHVTAGMGDYGFNQQWTLEIFNVNRAVVVLYPGMRIGQVSFVEVHEPEYYHGAYTKQSGPQEPVIGEERF